MDGWFIAIFIIIIASWFLETALALLNIRNQSDRLPPEFRDIYTPEKYLKAMEYHKATTYLSLLEKGTSTVLLLIFLNFGGFNYIDTLARSYDSGEISSGLLFIGLLSLLSFVCGLPFQLYSTFVVEERFGFNRTTFKTFILDSLKSGILLILFGVPLLAGIIWFFTTAGSYAWMYCWGATVIFSFLIQLLAPIIIMPLFNKFTPLPSGALKNAITEYAEKHSFTLQGIFTMDGSKRSSKLNAFFTGFGRLKKVVLFDTLIAKLNTDEIVAVLAHEIGHAKLKHLYKGLGIFVLQSGFIFYLLSIFLTHSGLTHAFGMEVASVYASLFFFGILFTPISMFLSICVNALSRKHEYEADNFAATTMGSSHSLITGLKTLTEENLGNLTPHPLYVLFYYSHPPLSQRIESLEKISSINII